jgi:hypothetical protein
VQIGNVRAHAIVVVSATGHAAPPPAVPQPGRRCQSSTSPFAVAAEFEVTIADNLGADLGVTDTTDVANNRA